MIGVRDGRAGALRGQASMTGSVWVFKAAGWWAVGGVFGSFREAASAVGRWGLSGDIHEVVADVLPHTWAVEQELVASDVPISVDDLRGVLGDHWASRTACEGVVHESPPVPPRGRESGESADLWVFQSRDLAWPGAVFSSQASARRCIAEAQLSGILTEYHGVSMRGVALRTRHPRGSIQAAEEAGRRRALHRRVRERGPRP